MTTNDIVCWYFSGSNIVTLLRHESSITIKHEIYGLPSSLRLNGLQLIIQTSTLIILNIKTVNNYLLLTQSFYMMMSYRHQLADWVCQHRSCHPTVHSPDQLTNQPMQPTNQPTNQPINQPTNQPINQPTNQPPIYLFINSFTSPRIIF